MDFGKAGKEAKVEGSKTSSRDGEIHTCLLLNCTIQTPKSKILLYPYYAMLFGSFAGM